MALVITYPGWDDGPVQILTGVRILPIFTYMQVIDPQVSWIQEVQNLRIQMRVL
jgi:hypothetical protein